MIRIEEEMSKTAVDRNGDAAARSFRNAASGDHADEWLDDG